MPEKDRFIREDQRVLAARLDVSLAGIVETQRADALIQEALAGKASQWELSLAGDLGLEKSGQLSRRELRAVLYDSKKGIGRSALYAAMQRMGQWPEFIQYFAILQARLVPGTEVITWAKRESFILTADYGNSRYKLKGGGSTAHLTAIQAVYRILERP